MPGLIAVAGRADSAMCATRAAEPMLRRPWQTLALVSSAGGDVTLAVAGEHGGVASDPETGLLAALQGEFAGPPRSGPEAARELLELYRRHGDTLDPPDGAWAAAVWDEERGHLVLLTDPLLQRPVYVTRLGAAVVAAGELKALVAAGLRPRLDLQAWAERLAYEVPISVRALLDDVRMIPGGTTLVVSGERDEPRERWRLHIDPAAARDEAELVDEFGRVFERAVYDRLTDDTALALSSGLDSRCIAAALTRIGFTGLAATYGTAASQDMIGGTEIAARARLRHHALMLEPGYVVRGAAEIVWLDEGRTRCFHTQHLALRQLRDDGCRSALVGLYGDMIIRGSGVPVTARGHEAFIAGMHRELAQAVSDRLHDELLTPQFADELRGRASAALNEALAVDIGDRFARWSEILCTWTSPTADFDDDLTGRAPFTDRRVIDVCRKLPLPLRDHGRLQRSYLRRFPELAGVTSPKQGLAPRARGWRERVGLGTERLRSRVHETLDRLPGPGRRRDPVSLSDYRVELRHSGAGLLSVLLEPRTLDRGQLRREGVRRLIEQTLAGRAPDTKALGMLLTLELFQRQLVDGDGLASVAGERAAAG